MDVRVFKFVVVPKTIDSPMRYIGMTCGNVDLQYKTHVVIHISSFQLLQETDTVNTFL